MVLPSAGDVVAVRFPFSDLSASKIRPAVVLASSGKQDWVLCQVTSNAYSDARAVTLNGAAFSSGGLRVTSYARPGKLFTANEAVMVGKEGALTLDALKQVIEAVVALLQAHSKS